MKSYSPARSSFGPACKLILSLATAALLPLSSAQADGTGPWLSTWGASPLAPLVVPGMPPAAAFNNQTIRQIVRISAGGNQLSIRLSNEFGTAALEIGEVHIALAGQGGAIIPGTDRTVTFGGESSFTIPSGAPALSDPIKMNVPDLARLAVSIYLPTDTGPATTHIYGQETSYITQGDTTAAVNPQGAFPSPRASSCQGFT